MMHLTPSCFGISFASLNATSVSPRRRTPGWCSARQHRLGEGATLQRSYVMLEMMRDTGAAAHTEGPVARAIEQQTAKLPSDTFLWLAGASIAGSLTLKMMGRAHDALFVGQWAPTFLILGLYNKIVKVA